MPLYSGRAARALYASCPVPLQNLVVSAYGLRLRQKYEGTSYRKWLARLQDSQWHTPRELSMMEEGILRKFLCSAYDHSEYWRRTMNALGVHPASDDPLSVVAAMPVLEKETVIANADTMRSSLLRSRGSFGVRWSQTSGTTGKALRLAISRDAVQREYAFRDLHRSWSGFHPGERCAVLMSFPVVPVKQVGPPFWRFNHGQNQLMLSAPHISERNMLSYLVCLKKYKPSLIHGFPSGVHLLALGCLKHNETSIRPRAVFTSQETLLAHQRATIEEAFGCKVYDWYGNTELAGNIVECEHGKRHVKRDHSYVEFCDDRGNAMGPGSDAELVVTAFGNFAMPLIRYRTGDVVVLSHDERCGCGRSGPIVREVVGRVNDFVIAPDGRHVRVSSDALRHVNGVAEAQIVQSEIGRIVVRIVAREGFRNDEVDGLLADIRAYVGHNMRIDIERVDHIDRGPGNKFRYVVSSLPVSVGPTPLAQGELA